MRINSMKKMDSVKKEIRTLIVDHQTEGSRKEFSNNEEFQKEILELLDEDVMEVKIVKRKKTE